MPETNTTFGGHQEPSDDVALKQFTNFFTVVGYAITQWAHIDSLLFEFCHFALGTSEEKAATIFYRSPHISDHNSLVDKLMPLCLPKKHRPKWRKISKEIVTNLQFRNHIAHNPPRHILYAYALADLLQERPVQPRHDPYEIVTAPTKLLAKKPLEKSRFEQILAHINVVGAIHCQMRTLRDALPRRARKLREERPQPKAPPRKAPRKRKRRISPKQ